MASHSPEPQQRIKLTIEYDGTSYCGWQRQDNALAVQQVLEEACTGVLGRPVSVLGASRTDSGVHALGQVCHFDGPTVVPVEVLPRVLNSVLPNDIACQKAETKSAPFHSRFSSKGKHYRYRILTAGVRSALRHRFVWYRHGDLQLDVMRQAAQHLLGELDFSAFRATGCSAKTAVRNISSIEIERQDDEVVLDVRGNAFLRNMVRIIAGTLCCVGEGRLSPDDVKRILEAGTREHAGVTAPAAGLCLVSVSYNDEPVID